MSCTVSQVKPSHEARHRSQPGVEAGVDPRPTPKKDQRSIRSRPESMQLRPCIDPGPTFTFPRLVPPRPQSGLGTRCQAPIAYRDGAALAPPARRAAGAGVRAPVGQRSGAVHARPSGGGHHEVRTGLTDPPRPVGWWRGVGWEAAHGARARQDAECSKLRAFLESEGALKLAARLRAKARCRADMCIARYRRPRRSRLGTFGEPALALCQADLIHTSPFRPMTRSRCFLVPSELVVPSEFLVRAHATRACSSTCFADNACAHSGLARLGDSKCTPRGPCSPTCYPLPQAAMCDNIVLRVACELTVVRQSGSRSSAGDRVRPKAVGSMVHANMRPVMAEGGFALLLVGAGQRPMAHVACRPVANRHQGGRAARGEAVLVVVLARAATGGWKWPP